MKHRVFYLLIGLAAVLMCSCTSRISSDPSLRLSFSVDTLRFDTVFTGLGTATQRITIFNPNKQALCISRASMQEGKYFQVNIDGESDPTRLSNLTILGGDSLFVFVKVKIDPTDALSPVLVTDRLLLDVNDHTEAIVMEAYGQNVQILRSVATDQSLHLTADKPYLIYNYLYIDSLATLTMDAGTRLYFYSGAQLIVRGSWEANGTLEQPILLRSHRLDNIYDSVPYNLVAGQWDGVFLMPGAGMAPTYELNYVDIMSSAEGIYCYNTDWKTGSELPTLHLTNSRIHNLAEYGLVLINMDATLANTEISNAAQYCVYTSGGTHTFIHTTIASYFGNTSVNYQNAQQKDVAALYIDNAQKTHAPMQTYVYNSVITGVRQNNLLLATPFPATYPGEISHSYLRSDSISSPIAHDNIYWRTNDTVYVNDCFSYHGHVYYDFRPDTVSVLSGIADTIHALLYPTDRYGRERRLPAAAGCYEPKER